MEGDDVGTLDAELREVLREAGFGTLVDEVDATIAEGRSRSEKRRIDNKGVTDELVAIDYTPAERYELLLDAARRATVEPADFEQSIDARLLARGSAHSVSFVDPEGLTARRVEISRRGSTQEDFERDARGPVDRSTATAIDDILSRLDPRREADHPGA